MHQTRHTDQPADREPPTASPTVFVVDDDQAFRRSLSLLLRASGWPVEEYPTAQAFLDRYAPSQPGCLIVDYAMPGTSGIQLLQQLRDRGVRIPAIVISACAEVETVRDAFRAGVSEFIEKPFTGAEIGRAVERCLELDRRQREGGPDRTDARNRLDTLTARERGIALQLAQGKVNKEIAHTLGISARTVEVHRANINRKLRVGSIPELVRLLHRADALPEVDPRDS